LLRLVLVQPLAKRMRLHFVPRLALTQTSFQRRAWGVAESARSSADRADARILMRMIELVDCGDYEALEPLAQALQAEYRELLGLVPGSPEDDAVQD